MDSVVGDKERSACVVCIKTKPNNTGGGLASITFVRHSRFLTKYHDNHKVLSSRGPTKLGSVIIKYLSHAEEKNPNPNLNC